MDEGRDVSLECDLWKIYLVMMDTTSSDRPLSKLLLDMDIGFDGLVSLMAIIADKAKNRAAFIRSLAEHFVHLPESD